MCCSAADLRLSAVHLKAAVPHVAVHASVTSHCDPIIALMLVGAGG